MKVISLPLSKVIYKLNVKSNVLSNRLTNQSHFLYIVSLGWGNLSLYKRSRSHDRNGGKAINRKKPLKIFFSYDFETWQEA